MRKKLLKTLNLVICFELVFLPFQTAMAKDGEGSEEKVFNKASKFVQGTATFLNETTKVYADILQQEAAAQAQARASQVNPELFNKLRMTPIDLNQVPPIFTNYNKATGQKKSCIVLQARSNQVGSDLQCNNLTPQQLFAGTANTLIKAAEANLNDIENLLTKGNERFTTEGLGCYQKGIDDFKVQLEAREEELSKLTNALKERVDEFKKLSEADLEAVKGKTALLTGKPADKLNDTDFSSPFGGDNVCFSFMDQNNFNSTGKKSGLRGIRDLLQKEKDKPAPGGLSASSFNNGTYRRLRNEIKKTAKNLAGKIKLQGGLANAIPDLDDLTTTNKTFGKKNPGLVKALGNFKSNFGDKLQDIQNDFNISDIRSNPALASALSDIENGRSGTNRVRRSGPPGKNIGSRFRSASSLDKKLNDFEISQKNNCLNEKLASDFGSIEKFAKSFKDPQISKKANRDSDSSFANYIADVLSEGNLTIEEKLRKIQAKQKKGANSRMYFQTGKSFTFKGRTISASTPLKPAQIVGMFTETCTDRFEKTSVGQSISPKQMVENLRSYNTQLQSLTKTAKSELRKEIESQMIECTDRRSEPQSAGGCSDALNTSSDNFCLKNAQTCASNMKACYNKSIEVADKIVKERKRFVDNYNKSFENYKKKIALDLKAINGFMEQQARQLDARLQLGTLYNVPPLSFDNLSTDENRLLAGVDPELKMEDPQAYFDLAEKQIEDLKKSLADQKTEALLAAEKVKSDIEENLRTEQGKMQQIVAECNAKIDAVNNAQNKAAEKQNEKINENNERINRVCSVINAANQNEDALTAVDNDFIQDALKVAVQSNPTDQRTLSTLYAAQGAQKKADESEVDIDSFSNEEAYSTCIGDGEFQGCSQLLADGPTRPCDFTELKEKAAGKKLCKAEGKNYYSLFDGTKCADGKEPREITEAIINGSSDTLDDGIFTAIQCRPFKNEGNTVRESRFKAVRRAMVAEANSVKYSKQGEVKLGFQACGGVDSGEVAGKNLLNESLDTARNLAAARSSGAVVD